MPTSENEKEGSIRFRGTESCRRGIRGAAGKGNGRGVPFPSRLGGLESVASSPLGTDHMFWHILGLKSWRSQFRDKKCAVFDVLQKYEISWIPHRMTEIGGRISPSARQCKKDLETDAMTLQANSLLVIISTVLHARRQLTASTKSFHRHKRQKIYFSCAHDRVLRTITPYSLCVSEANARLILNFTFALFGWPFEFKWATQLPSDNYLLLYVHGRDRVKLSSGVTGDCVAHFANLFRSTSIMHSPRHTNASRTWRYPVRNAVRVWISMRFFSFIPSSDVNKDLSLKAKTKAKDLSHKAKAKDSRYQGQIFHWSSPYSVHFHR